MNTHADCAADRAPLPLRLLCWTFGVGEYATTLASSACALVRKDPSLLPVVEHYLSAAGAPRLSDLTALPGDRYYVETPHDTYMVIDSPAAQTRYIAKYGNQYVLWDSTDPHTYIVPAFAYKRAQFERAKLAHCAKYGCE